jgi:hypothetical protein
MGSDDNEVYIITDAGGNGEWFSPKPADAAIADAVAAETGLDADDLDDIGAYVDPGELRDVLGQREGAVAFRIEGREVTVEADGTIEVAGSGK